MSARAWSGIGVDYDQTFDETRRIQQHHESDNIADSDDVQPGEVTDQRLKIVKMTQEVTTNPESGSERSHGTLRAVDQRNGLQTISRVNVTGSTQLVEREENRTPQQLGLTEHAAMFDREEHVSGDPGGSSRVSLEQRMTLSVDNEVLEFNPVDLNSQEIAAVRHGKQKV
jgi:hypothetical protein